MTIRLKCLDQYQVVRGAYDSSQIELGLNKPNLDSLRNYCDIINQNSEGLGILGAEVGAETVEEFMDNVKKRLNPNYSEYWNFTYVPSINLYISKDRTLLNSYWNKYPKGLHFAKPKNDNLG